jgi:ZIP family zinc transporter
MATTTAPSPSTSRDRGARTLFLFVLPIVLLAGVIGLFAYTDGAGLNVEPAAPIEDVEFGQTVLKPGRIDIHVRNTGQEDLTISQVNINDAIWPFTISKTTIPRLGSATVSLDYPWVKAQAYEITLLSSNSIPFTTSIPVAAETASASSKTLWSFTLVGIYVGVIPVVLGMFWLPVLRQIGPQTMLFLMAATVGLLIYLGIDATSEALEQAGNVGGPFQGTGLVGIGIVGTFLFLDAIGRRQAMTTRGDGSKRLALAWMIAVGIGFHNFGEGLAIGAAYAIGAASLGTFLVIGFIIQNITEGLGIVVPIAKDRPSLRTLALLSAVGGGPAIVGAWVGGFLTAPAFSVLFLAIGAGAVFQVAYAIGKQLVWNKDAKNPMPMTAFAGVTTGMLALFVTGLLVK